MQPLRGYLIITKHVKSFKVYWPRKKKNIVWQLVSLAHGIPIQYCVRNAWEKLLFIVVAAAGCCFVEHSLLFFFFFFFFQLDNTISSAFVCTVRTCFWLCCMHCVQWKHEFLLKIERNPCAASDVYIDLFCWRFIFFYFFFSSPSSIFPFFRSS